MRYTCWGAARQVTGSMHLLETADGYTILLDCGLDYEDQQDPNTNHVFPFEPAEIDVLILSHAHIDHSGNIPNLVRQGFGGSIICTEPTSFLLEKLWMDSVNIQNMERKRSRNAARLYGYADVKRAMDQVLTIPFYREFELKEGLVLTFHEAGHILGAASIALTYQERGKTRRLGFTGDLGNYNSTLIVDPKPMKDLDILISESTYASREHRVKLSAEEELKNHVMEACVKRGGKLIIPAFSVGRTQAILYTLKNLFDKGELPLIRVFADSPLALASTNIHYRFRDYLNQETRLNFSSTGELFSFDNLVLIEDEDDEEDMDYYRDASILVSASGMMDGGRIQRHLQDQVMNPLCTILIAGYCTPGTIGAKLLEGVNPIRILNKERYVYAKIKQTDVFSAHPDQHGLLKYYKETGADKLQKIFLVHGVDHDMEAFEKVLGQEFNSLVIRPEKGIPYEL